MYGTRHKKIRYIFVVLANIFINLYYFIKIRPDVVISTGAHTAVPMCILAKIFRKKVIYIETYANRTSKTSAGRLLYHVANVFVVQWEEMLELYPKAKYFGGIY